jgi:hypothetical protein
MSLANYQVYVKYWFLLFLVDQYFILDMLAPSLLRSTSIAETSSLLLTDPPLCSALVLSPRGATHSYFSLNIRRQVHKFDSKAYIEFMPPLCRLPLCLLCQLTSKLIPSQAWRLVLTVFWTLSTPHQGFTYIHLLNMYLIVLGLPFPYRSRQLLLTNAA